MLNENLNHHRSSATTTVTGQSIQAGLMRSHLRRWIRPLIIILLAVITAAIVSVLLTNFVWTGLPVGEPAPIFGGFALNGEQIDLGSYRGQPVMLTFWSPDCFACREELPALQELANDPNATMKLVTVVSRLPRAEVAQFVDKQGLDFPILVDPTGAIAKLYEVSGIPFTYFIDQSGRIDQAVMGAGNEGDLQNSLFTWLKSCQIGQECSVK